MEGLKRLEDRVKAMKAIRAEARREARIAEKSIGRKFSEIEKLNFISGWVFNKTVKDKSKIIDYSKYYK
ncbi:MAG: hypothetical protein PHD37_10765 [Gallionellaceae bacterium]|nr:hypothetical protein [Gallionellaceae bacterium]